jgi:phosphoglycolate phosphatase
MQEFKQYKTVFFDLDGTLTDSKIGIIRCLQYSLEKFGIEENDIEKLTRCIGPSLSFTYQQWYGLTADQARQGTEYYRERFEKEGIRENLLYDGVLPLLETLKNLGKTIVLATAKPTVHAKQILQYHKIDSYFTEVCGSNLDGTREDKGAVIEFALSKLEQVNKQQIVMIGDRKHDVIGAKENGLASVAVAYGYGTETELMEAVPDKIVYSVDEIRQMFVD